MNFELRTLIVALAAFAGTGLIVGALVPWLARRTAPVAAESRARRLTRLRLWPAASGAVMGLAATAAFLMFESRRPRESVSGLVIGLAAVGAALIVASAWRWVRLVMATREAARGWCASAEPVSLPGIAVPARTVDAAFPIVAVIGLFKPTLIIARSVLTSCTTDELRAILAHEQSHLNRRDNLRRLAMTATPDLLAWLPTSSRLFSAWCEATEEAADDDAASDQRDGRLHLASALVKVARLAANATTPATVPAAALYSGGSLEGRVRRLLDRSALPRARQFGTLKLLAALSFAVAVVVFAAQLPGVHDWIEAALHTLP